MHKVHMRLRENARTNLRGAVMFSLTTMHDLSGLLLAWRSVRLATNLPDL